MSGYMVWPFLLTVVIIGLGWAAGHYRTQIAEHIPSNLLGGLKTAKKGGVVMLAILAAYILVFTDLPVKVINWDWSSTPIGNDVDSKFGPGAAVWLWLVPAAAAFYFLRKKKDAGAKNPFAQKVPMIDNFSLLVFWSVAGVVVLAITWIVLSFAGKDHLIENAVGLTEPERAVSVSCLEPGELDINRDLKIPVAGKKLSICGQAGGQFTLFEPHGYRLEIFFTDKFRRENREVLMARNEESFVEIKAPMTFTGSGSTSWKIVLDGKEFQRSGLENIEFFVQAVRR